MGVRFSHPQPNRSRKAAVFSGHSAAGSAPGSGLGGRGFKSRCSDQKTDAERHPSFLLPPGAYPANATDPTKSTISTVSRYPPKPTKPTISTKSRFHGTLRKSRNQRNQRNHDFTVPYENHEINGFNEITISRCPNGITKATISTVSRYPTKSTKATVSTKATKCPKKRRFVVFVVYV